MKNKKFWLRLAAVAAVLIVGFLMVRMGWLDPSDISTDIPVYTEEDPTTAPTSVTTSAKTTKTTKKTTTAKPVIDEAGEYTSKKDVALYLYTYGHLPSNFITKQEAQSLGWTGGKLEKYAPGKSIGGDYFGNFEGLLPSKKGRTWHECDIDTLKKERGVKRIVYSNDGLIYYTDDHYETYTLLYGEP